MCTDMCIVSCGNARKLRQCTQAQAVIATGHRADKSGGATCKGAARLLTSAGGGGVSEHASEHEEWLAGSGLLFLLEVSLQTSDVL